MYYVYIYIYIYTFTYIHTLLILCISFLFVHSRIYGNIDNHIYGNLVTYMKHSRTYGETTPFLECAMSLRCFTHRKDVCFVCFTHRKDVCFVCFTHRKDVCFVCFTHRKDVCFVLFMHTHSREIHQRIYTCITIYMCMYMCVYIYIYTHTHTYMVVSYVLVLRHELCCRVSQSTFSCA
jgi:hypothetical protein